MNYGFLHRVGVNLARNEISLKRCTLESCYINFQDFPASSWNIRKPGNLPMTINTLFQARRQLGLEEQLHNLNGLLE